MRILYCRVVYIYIYIYTYTTFRKEEREIIKYLWRGQSSSSLWENKKGYNIMSHGIKGRCSWTFKLNYEVRIIEKLLKMNVKEKILS